MPKRAVKPAPVEATTFWLELDEDDVHLLLNGIVPGCVHEACESFNAWLGSPAEGIAHDRAVRFSQAIEAPDRGLRGGLETPELPVSGTRD